MKEPYNATRWRQHVKNCQEQLRQKLSLKNPSARTPSLTQVGWTVVENGGKEGLENSSQSLVKVGSQRMVPCPGITCFDDEQVTKYLRRTSFRGGGARSETVLAQERFGVAYRELSKEQKKEVITAQLHEQRWINDHDNARVFSTTCKHSVADKSPKRPLPCPECRGVLASKSFKNALFKRPVNDRNYRFTNKRFWPKGLGAIYATIVGVREVIQAAEAVCASAT